MNDFIKAVVGDYEDGGTAVAGDFGVAATYYEGRSIAGSWGTAVTGRCGLAIAGDGGVAIAGYRGAAQAGEGGLIIIEGFDENGNRLFVARVGEGGILANTPYCLGEDGDFVLV